MAVWESIVGDEEKRRRFQRERGKGGFVRADWDQAATMIAAALIHTIKRHGPDRVFGFSPILAMRPCAAARGSTAADGPITWGRRRFVPRRPGPSWRSGWTGSGLRASKTARPSYYFATDQWRYDTLRPETVLSPLARSPAARHMADYNATAARLGWLPSYPQFDRNPLDIVRDAEAAGAASDEEIAAFAVERLKKGELRFAVEDPDNPANFPRVLFLWRANLLGASGKGHEYFLKHLLGADHAVLNTDGELRPERIEWREPAPEGKLDLLVTMELRMSTSAMYADIALPAAGWYEMHDLNTTDMHPFVHPFNPAIDPPWETRTNWEQFKTVARKFSELAAVHLGTVRGTWWRRL